MAQLREQKIIERLYGGPQPWTNMELVQLQYSLHTTILHLLRPSLSQILTTSLPHPVTTSLCHYLSPTLPLPSLPLPSLLSLIYISLPLYLYPSLPLYSLFLYLTTSLLLTSHFPLFCLSCSLPASHMSWLRVSTVDGNLVALTVADCRVQIWNTFKKQLVAIKSLKSAPKAISLIKSHGVIAVGTCEGN